MTDNPNAALLAQIVKPLLFGNQGNPFVATQEDGVEYRVFSEAGATGEYWCWSSNLGSKSKGHGSQELAMADAEKADLARIGSALNLDGVAMGLEQAAQWLDAKEPDDYPQGWPDNIGQVWADELHVASPETALVVAMRVPEIAAVINILMRMIPVLEAADMVCMNEGIGPDTGPILTEASAALRALANLPMGGK